MNSRFTIASLLHTQAASTVAVFRALQVGDMLCAVPALRALRQAMPSAQITLVGLPWAKEFAQRFHRYVDDLVAFPGHPDFPEQPVQRHLLAGFYAQMRERSFDLALQLHGSGPQSNLVTRAFGARFTAGHGEPVKAPHQHFSPYPTHGAEPQRLLGLLASLGVPASDAALEFPISEDDERELASTGMMRALDNAPYVCIHPGARMQDKCWHPAWFAQVADQLVREFGLNVVLTGSASEAGVTAAVAGYMRSPVIDAASAMSLGAMAAIFRRARLLVANDTGVSHIAAGLRLPSVIIFTKADIERWAPSNTELHRCLWDPAGERVQEVIRHARELLRAGRHRPATEPSA